MDHLVQYPKRHSNHSLEAESEAFFRGHVPHAWNINPVDHDYGQDLNLEISEGDAFRGLDLIVQLKSSQVSDSDGETERQRFSVSTYNYLRDNLRVVMIVKYVQDDGEAYWILLKDVHAPDQANGTFTIHLPRQNRLSGLDWNDIKNYVREITDRKLGRQRDALL